MKFVITSYGDRVVSRKLMRFSEAALVTRPVMEEVAVDMMRIERKVFSSQGRRGGGSWRSLSPSTVRKKIKMGQDPRILFATHRLFDSVTRAGHPDSALKISNDAIDFGSKRPGAVAHQKGLGVPQRKFINFTEADRRRWVKMVQVHLVSGFRRVG